MRHFVNEGYLTWIAARRKRERRGIECGGGSFSCLKCCWIGGVNSPHTPRPINLDSMRIMQSTVRSSNILSTVARNMINHPGEVGVVPQSECVKSIRIFIWQVVASFLDQATKKKRKKKKTNPTQTFVHGLSATPSQDFLSYLVLARADIL